MQYKKPPKSYEILTLTGFCGRARMFFMKNHLIDPPMEENQPPNQKLYLKNNLTWEEVGLSIPGGLFIVAGEGTLKIVNPLINELLGNVGDELNGKHYLDLFSLLSIKSRDPSETLAVLNLGVKNIQNNPVINLEWGADLPLSLEIRLFLEKDGDLSQGNWGGLIINRTTERTTLKREIELLQVIAQKSRGISAAVYGKLGALTGNIHTWTPEIVADFFTDVDQQMGLLNNQLDQILTFIQVLNRQPNFPEVVGVWEILNDVIKKRNGLGERVIQTGFDLPVFQAAQVDSTQIRLVFEYILLEMIQQTKSGSIIQITGEDLGDTVKIIFQSDKKLPPPAPRPIPEKEKTGDLNPRLYLAEQLISAQGGNFRISHPSIDYGIGLRMEVILPTSKQQEGFIESRDQSSIEKTKTSRILVADPQSEYQALFAKELGEVGYRVDLAVEGSAALDMVQVINPDLVVIDRDLAGMDGIMLTQGIRRWSAVPIIMVSSRGNPDDLVYAFQAGVDDYLNKPFLFSEMLVRIEANIKRGKNSNTSFVPEIYHSGSVRINYSTRQVWIRGKLVELTPIEYNLLSYMSRQGKQIMAYEQLIERAWVGPEKGSRQGVFVHVRRLRAKIEADPKKPNIIQNKWGVGYILSLIHI